MINGRMRKSDKWKTEREREIDIEIYRRMKVRKIERERDKFVIF